MANLHRKDPSETAEALTWNFELYRILIFIFIIFGGLFYYTACESTAELSQPPANCFGSFA